MRKMTVQPDCQPADAAGIEIVGIGAIRWPLIIIDGSTTRPQELVRYACQAGAFEEVSGNLYPGLRAPMPLSFVRAMAQRLDPLIREVYELGAARLGRVECFFSIVTTQPEHLLPYQTIPHIDTTDPLHFATVHYLCDAGFGGTAFFRQDDTALERISSDEDRAWAAARDVCLGGAIGSSYPSAQTPGYTQNGQALAAFDRLIVYPSNALHAGIIHPTIEHSPDPQRGRLTATMFIGYNPPAK